MTVFQWIAVCVSAGYLAFAFVVLMEVIKHDR